MNKSKIKMILKKHPSFLRHLQYMFNALCKRDRVMCKKSFGCLNKDKTILVIRPSSDDGVQGLMSLFVQTMRWIDYANSKGYTPFVDLKNYKTQYYDGVNNIWDYYFTQPSSLKLDEVYKSNKVVFSGSTWCENVNFNLYRGEIFKDRELCRKCYELIWNNINLSEEVKEIINKENKTLNVEDCFGVYVRGTDYVKLKPTGEYVQPKIEDVIDKINDFTEKYGNKDIFLVTEDDTYYQILLKKFGERIKLVSFDTFIKDYDGKDFLSKSGVLEENQKKRGMDYLVKILLLSKCRYLISSITMGSIATYSFNGDNYENKYIFDLGCYN
jgi:hypothetical protein